MVFQLVTYVELSDNLRVTLENGSRMGPRLVLPWAEPIYMKDVFYSDIATVETLGIHLNFFRQTTSK